MILVDTNILIDILIANPAWREWSSQALADASVQGVALNDLVYAELSAMFDTPSALDDAIAQFQLVHLPSTRAALFYAGRAFTAYRRLGGPGTSILPDFFIGAHAQAAGIALLTRDPRRYRQYFPDVPLITP